MVGDAWCKIVAKNHNQRAKKRTPHKVSAKRDSIRSYARKGERGSEAWLRQA